MFIYSFVQCSPGYFFEEMEVGRDRKISVRKKTFGLFLNQNKHLLICFLLNDHKILTSI